MTSASARLLERALPGCTHILYNQTHLELQSSLAKFIDTDVNPYVDVWEEQRAFPTHKLFKNLAGFGTFGANKPVEYGGLGLDFSYSLAIAETMGRVNCGAIPMAVAVQSDMATPALAKYGSDALRREFLVPAVSGDVVACIGVSEPHAGSDVAAIRTFAQRDGDDLVVNGSKMWITNGHKADWTCLLANTNRNASVHKNKSLIIVWMNEPGITRGRNIRKLGMHCSDTAEIFFDNVRVPAKNIVGEEGRGFVYQMEQFQDERLVTGAVLLEPLRRVIEWTSEYAKDRNVFGRPLLSRDYVRYELAEMSTELEALRSLLYRAVLERMSGSDVTLLASMVKLKAGRLARNVTDRCLQLWGGNGYTWENPVGRFYRDLRLHSIAAGCDEVMLSVIAQHMERSLNSPR